MAIEKFRQAEDWDTRRINEAEEEEEVSEVRRAKLPGRADQLRATGRAERFGVGAAKVDIHMSRCRLFVSFCFTKPTPARLRLAL